MLPMPEYAYNNLVALGSAISPFYANYGYDPRTTWQTEAEAQSCYSQNYMTWIFSVLELYKENLQKTYEKMSRC
jgi:hypothetical protein